MSEKYTIFKYSLGRPESKVKTLELPIGATVLSAGMQDELVVIWCLVNPLKLVPTVPRNFIVCGTGWDIAHLLYQYIGRVTEGVFEWHIMEVQ